MTVVNIRADVALSGDETEQLRILEDFTDQNGTISTMERNGEELSVSLLFPDHDSLKAAHENCVERGAPLMVHRLTHVTDSEENAETSLSTD